MASGKCPSCKTTWTTENLLAPGSVTTCGTPNCNTKFRWPLVTQDVYDALGSLGTRIGKGVYGQGARLKTFGYTNAEVQNGYCHSACLDWARRVIQGGRVSFEPSDKDKADKLRTVPEKRAKEEAQTDRAVNMHLNFKLGNIKTGSPWGGLSKTLDSSYLGAKKRSFGGIDQIYCKFDLKLNSVKGVVDHLTSQTGFSTNCCALLSFDYMSGGGHVVAVYQTNTSRFVLFDPNYTMFELPNIDKFYAALRYLFLDAVYPYQSSQWNGTVDVFVYSNNAGASKPTPIVQKISQTLQTVETTSVLSPPMPTIPVPLAVPSTATIPPSGATLEAPTAGATPFKENLWIMLNDAARKDGDYVKIAYSQKSEIEKNGGKVTPSSGGFRISRQDLVALYNKVK
jgi:hypothetical protein